MSATVVRAKRQTTLPEDVCKAAGIRIRDQVEWRYEGGEIRGRKLIPAVKRPRLVRPITFKDLLILPEHIEVDFEQVREDFSNERESRDERLLG